MFSPWHTARFMFKSTFMDEGTGALASANLLRMSFVGAVSPPLGVTGIQSSCQRALLWHNELAVYLPTLLHLSL